ncbi:GPN-loop GTPase 2-like [Corticium candelabrum]|uniref:GPN-loop GTPase 2-like n=1 Tax=Corticium candelabrum TaxID=121492 RepID=UPI002E27305E|nr:GPN-loop GTPase 2-like [Corticium candelabrum]
MPFGQLVIGPPGSGKTTYCLGMQQFLRQLGRNVSVVNLDPANDSLPYQSDIDMSELIRVEDVMSMLKLGPNGALIYCMEFLAENVEWLRRRLQELKSDYVLFDCPGQVELYTHNTAVRNIVSALQKWEYRLVSVHLVDSHHCSDPGKFIAVLLTSLSTMLQIQLPHINVLSKIDLIQQYGKLAFGLDFYTETLDLSYLLDTLNDDPFYRHYKKLNEAISGVVEDFSLVSFATLNVEDKESMASILKLVDKASGYVFRGSETGYSDMASLMSSATGADFDFSRDAAIREKSTEQEATSDDNEQEMMS